MYRHAPKQQIKGFFFNFRGLVPCFFAEEERSTCGAKKMPQSFQHTTGAFFLTRAKRNTIAQN
jgi:hypothetical protein